jgi:phospholipase C
MFKHSRNHSSVVIAICITAALAACNGSQNAGSVPSGATTAGPAAGARGTPSPPPSHKRHRLSDTNGPIKYIIVVIQENRTINNLFGGPAPFPGVLNTASQGQNSHGQMVTLSKDPLGTPCDPNHAYPYFRKEVAYDQATNTFKMNGWDLVKVSCTPGHSPADPLDFAFSYVDYNDTKIYWDLAKHFALADMNFQPNMGPSFTAHQYLIAGQAGGFGPPNPGATFPPYGETENPTISGTAGLYTTGGCEYGPTSQYKINVMNLQTQTYPFAQEAPTQAYVPCQDYKTIFDLLNPPQVTPPPTWRFYTPWQHYIWSAPIGISHLWQSPNIVVGPDEAQRFYNDVTQGQLQNLSYIVPCANWSDHPAVSNQPPPNGPNWVGFIANTIGQSRYWANTAIVVVWDDWGGWFDPQPPMFAMPNPYNPQPPSNIDPYEYGLRVPRIVISPYAIPGLVDHTPRSSVAILKFIEASFHTGSLSTLDSQSDDLSSMFNFQQPPNQPPNEAVSGFDSRSLPTCPGNHSANDIVEEF